MTDKVWGDQFALVHFRSIPWTIPWCPCSKREHSIDIDWCRGTVDHDPSPTMMGHERGVVYLREISPQVDISLKARYFRK